MQSRDIGGVFLAEGGGRAEDGGQESGVELRDQLLHGVAFVAPFPAFTLPRLRQRSRCAACLPRSRYRRQLAMANSPGCESEGRVGARALLSVADAPRAATSISGQKLGVARLTRFDIFRGLVELLRNTTQRAF